MSISLTIQSIIKVSSLQSEVFLQYYVGLTLVVFPPIRPLIKTSHTDTQAHIYDFMDLM